MTLPAVGTADSLLSLKPWLEAQPFMLLGSANAAGACDCSYRGRETQGAPEPLLQVVDENFLMLPDYRGNNLFNTIGNLFQNDQIAVLLVDFARQRTVMIQGRAQLMERDANASAAWQSIFPSAPRAIMVQVSRVQIAPVANLPHLELVPH